MKYAFTVFLLLTCGSCQGGSVLNQNTNETCQSQILNSDFQEAVGKFIRSVSERDRKAFENFFDPEKEFYALLPGGREYRNVADFLNSQQGLFSSYPPRITQELKRIYTAGSDMGVASILVTLERPDSTVTKSYVSLVFIKEALGWKIEHIQNTVVNAN